MASLIEGSLVGLLFDRLLKAVLEATQRIATFNSGLNSLKSTLLSLKDFFEQVARLNKVLHSPQHETDMFINRLREGETLVRNCSRVEWWNICRKVSYSRKITALEKSLIRFFQLTVQAEIVRDNKMILAEVNVLTKKVDELLSRSKYYQQQNFSEIDASFQGVIEIEPRCKQRN
ncbi:hypothetical protein ACH5RR_011399 [Cinchona calisaya]|uniref:RPW8 domain-containing protein n=1 Tax=Cinchona calisaya TaxID=153742 RepID=A0ABD3AAM3_9GENT